MKKEGHSFCFRKVSRGVYQEACDQMRKEAKGIQVSDEREESTSILSPVENANGDRREEGLTRDSGVRRTKSWPCWCLVYGRQSLRSLDMR